MKNEPKLIPTALFDLMQDVHFGQLRPDQKDEVLKYFDEEEYNDMHGAACGIKTCGEHLVHRHSKQRMKDELLKKFETKHRQRPRIKPFNYPVKLWQAAAAGVLLAVIAIMFYTLGDPEVVQHELVAVADTVYVDREKIVTEKGSADTIYIYKAVPEKKPGTLTGKADENLGTETLNDVNVMTLKDLDSSPNSSKNNSLAFDTLSRVFEPVTL